MASSEHDPAMSTKGGAAHSGCACSCHDPLPKGEGCCELVCFERPKYFCGHLLTDADLTAEQTYLREKNKLYHRTLDGYGVVCGLRLTCDRDCKGHIRVGDGYAIDDCGNDLVVCKPQTFDVMGELRKRKWLVEPPGIPAIATITGTGRRTRRRADGRRSGSTGAP